MPKRLLADSLFIRFFLKQVYVASEGCMTRTTCGLRVFFELRKWRPRFLKNADKEPFSVRVGVLHFFEYDYWFFE